MDYSLTLILYGYEAKEAFPSGHSDFDQRGTKAVKILLWTLLTVDSQHTKTSTSTRHNDILFTIF